MIKPLYHLDENDELMLTLPDDWLDEFAKGYQWGENFSDQISAFLTKKECLIHWWGQTDYEVRRVFAAVDRYCPEGETRLGWWYKDIE